MLCLQQILLGKTTAGTWCLQGCKHLVPWNIRMQEKISADPGGDGASPFQKSPVCGKGFTVNPGTQPVSPIFYLSLLCIIPKLCISGTKSAKSQVNRKSPLSQMYQDFSGI